jgi:hypothetical protein
MEVKYSLYVNGYDNKERIVEALTNSGYIVGAELEKDRIFGTKGWRIDIYNDTSSKDTKKEAKENINKNTKNKPKPINFSDMWTNDAPILIAYYYDCETGKTQTRYFKAGTKAPEIKDCYIYKIEVCNEYYGG